MKAANMKMDPDYGEEEFASPPSVKRKHLYRRSVGNQFFI